MPENISQPSLSSSAPGAGSPPPAPGVQTGSPAQNFLDHFKHPAWLVGLGAATLLVMILYFIKSRSSSTTSTATPDTTSTYPGTLPGQSGSSGQWGSQLDSDYQQMTQQSTITNSLLQQLLTSMQNPPTPTPTPTPTPVPPGTGTLKAWWSGNPLAAGTKIKWGTQGQSFYQTPGSQTWNPLAGPQYSNEFLGNNGIFDYIIAGQHGEYFVQQQQTIGGQKVLSPQRVLVAPHA